MKRLFVALEPPLFLQESLAALNPDLPGMRWVRAEQVHLTLGFFGELSGEVETRLREQLSLIRFRGFVLNVRDVGAFPAKGPPRIIWIGLGRGHPHLFQIHKRVQEAALAAGLEPDLRSWHPHITLARCHKVSEAVARKLLDQQAGLDAGMFRVEAFFLFSSELTPEGSSYRKELIVSCQGDS